MTSPSDRARDRDRDAAVKSVDAALAAGRIVAADHDKRVQEIRSAQTMQDIYVQTADLQSSPPAPAPSPAPASAPTPAPAPVPGGLYGPSQGGGVPVSFGQLGNLTSVGRLGRRLGGIAAAVAIMGVVLPVVGVVIGLASSHNSFHYDTGTPTDDATYLPGQDPGASGVNVHTVAGYNAMVAALRQQTGSTSVYVAVLYPRYAVLDVPDTSGSGHYQSYYYDGKTLAGEDFKDTTDDPPLDLTSIDPNLMISELEKVRARVTDPTSWYCVADAPKGQAPELSCYATNDYKDSSYVVVGLDGTVIYDSANPSGAVSSPSASAS